jgi:hypothetical protein
MRKPSHFAPPSKVLRHSESRCNWPLVHSLKGERTLGRLARDAGISADALRFAEAHNSGLSEGMLERLAGVLGVPLEALKAARSERPVKDAYELTSLGLGGGIIDRG